MSKISSHEEKMVNLQVQMRQNQSELQDYLADLDSWEDDIKKKDKEHQLKPGSENHKEALDLPPVRNTIHKKKLKKKKKEKSVDMSKKKKISGYDFRAWDKFDVDKALEDIDAEEKKDTSSSEYETDEEWEVERKKHLAGQEKEKGNKYLKAGELDQAIEAYSKGMEFDPTNAILPANRAMALLKQQKFAAAEFDCTTSISLDPLYVKAYLRRATARSGMGKLDNAIADFNRVLDLEPTNKQAKTEMERLQKEMQRDKEGPVATTLTEDQKGRVKPIYKPPEERSKKPLVRIPIEEIGLEANVRPVPSIEQSELTRQIVDKEKKEFDKLFSSKCNIDNSILKENNVETNTVSAMISNQEDKLVLRGKNCHEDPKTLNGPTQSPENISAEEPQTRCGSQNTTETVSSTKGQNKLKVLPNGNTSNLSGKVQGGTSEAHLPSEGYTVPQTSFQFQTDFKTLKSKPEAFYQYFQAIPPTCYPKLFGQSFDADILMTILRSLEAFDTGSSTYEILSGLTEVKRFSMAAMFLSKKDKFVVENLMGSLQDNHIEQEVAILRKKYGL